MNTVPLPPFSYQLLKPKYWSAYLALGFLTLIVNGGASHFFVCTNALPPTKKKESRLRLYVEHKKGQL